MRTNIILDDQLIDEARLLTGIKTKRAVIQEALRTLIQLRKQSSVRGLRGKLKWEGDLEEQRLGRMQP
jgi:Arc/MetJ family transcription regulator